MHWQPLQAERSPFLVAPCSILFPQGLFGFWAFLSNFKAQFSSFSASGPGFKSSVSAGAEGERVGSRLRPCPWEAALPGTAPASTSTRQTSLPTAETDSPCHSPCALLKFVLRVCISHLLPWKGRSVREKPTWSLDCVQIQGNSLCKEIAVLHEWAGAQFRAYRVGRRIKAGKSVVAVCRECAVVVRGAAQQAACLVLARLLQHSVEA